MSVYEMALMYLNWHGGSRATFVRHAKVTESLRSDRSVRLTASKSQEALVQFLVINNTKKNKLTVWVYGFVSGFE